MTPQEKATKLEELRKKYPELEHYYDICTYISMMIMTNVNIESNFEKLEAILIEDRRIKRESSTRIEPQYIRG